MARQSRPSFKKRQKEVQRQQRAQAKAAQRAEIRQQKADKPVTEDGQDPELEGIRPGPQPPPDWMVVVPRKS
jgi:hypothetical protein